MIDDDLRRELVDTLMRVQGIDAPNRVARDVLLAGVPNAGYFQRNDANARGDITVLVLQLEDTYTAAGTWRLLKLIDNALPQVKETSLGEELMQLRVQLQQKAPLPIRPNPAEYAKPYRFDLRKMSKLCLALVEGSPRLCGFVAQTQSVRLLENLCQALKHRGHEDGTWDRTRVSIPPVMVVDPRHTPVKTVIEKAMCVKRLLARNIVILSFKFVDVDDALTFWEEISTAFAGELDSHLVVLMGVPEGCPKPIGTQELPAPVFERQHAIDWVNEIIATLRWSDNLVSDWVQLIETLCYLNAGAGALHVETVYYQLDLFRSRLTDCITEDDFRAVLQEMKDIGELYAITH